ncbi:hypothetical protein OIU77_006479 [Salix suchowensis]|uniref:Uncharacterized protein n=1 Tax=Salix suchowensis TaxID=1278906 RepID=A0ABQ9AKU9_9ROSI|nr:hypothetical protein OIU78_022986 [Salix suchowensis]KAJ6348898.1 hypothetical protein OIU77_006479 [Salix suchowensis]
MDQGSSSKEEIQGNVFQISCSRSTFVEVFNALLRCLGFGTVDDHQTINQDSSSTSSSAREDDEKASGESPQFPTPTSTTSDPQADPPMDTPQAGPPMDTSEDDPSADAAPSALLRRTPPVSSGGGGRIN